MTRSRRADGAYIRVAGCWACVYRAIDSAGATIDPALTHAGFGNGAAIRGIVDVRRQIYSGPRRRRLYRQAS
ncbi:MAG: hypothetical protein DMG58_25960 [Acidobacteria bacterium]|nr:MAG: hypothetical protein DMG58_25960 [Acidobacteriota bacterium]